MIMLLLAQGWAATATASPDPYVRCLAERAITRAAETQDAGRIIETAEQACIALRDSSLKDMIGAISNETYLSTGQVDTRSDQELLAAAAAQLRHMLTQIITEKRATP